MEFGTEKEVDLIFVAYSGIYKPVEAISCILAYWIKSALINNNFCLFSWLIQHCSGVILGSAIRNYPLAYAILAVLAMELPYLLYYLLNPK